MTNAQMLANGWKPTKLAVPVAAFPGWTETDVAPRLVEMRHPDALVVRVYTVGWGRGTVAVVMPDGTEKRFGRLPAALAFALEYDPVTEPGYLLDSDLVLLEDVS